MAMTWKELADFINNEMPECNRDQIVRVWDYGNDGGYFDAIDVSEYDSYESANEDNIYSIGVNTEKRYL